MIDRLNEWVGRTCGFAIVVLTGLTVLEVVMRRFFNRPTVWSHDIAIMFYGFHFMVNSGYTMLYKGHVSIDLIYSKLSLKGQIIFDIIGYSVFFFPFVVALLYQGTIYAMESWAMKEVGWGMFESPVYLYKTVIPVFAFLTLIQGFATICRSILRFREVSNA
jgi:TRAP-type mannitol/chloroaromatic compound transport system permease small subunit